MRMTMRKIFPDDRFLKRRCPFDVPQEQPKIARHFNAGLNCKPHQVPQGRQKKRTAGHTFSDVAQTVLMLSRKHCFTCVNSLHQSSAPPRPLGGDGWGEGASIFSEYGFYRATALSACEADVRLSPIGSRQARVSPQVANLRHSRLPVCATSLASLRGFVLIVFIMTAVLFSISAAHAETTNSFV